MVRFRDADQGEALSVLAHCGFMEAGESGTQRTCSPGGRGGSAMEIALLGMLMCLTGSATTWIFSKEDAGGLWRY